MAATVRGQRETNGGSEGPFDLAASEASRGRSRLPEILVGTLLVALFALAGAWFYSTSTSRVGYLALRDGLSRGEVIERSDLTVFQLNTDAPIRAMPAAQVGEVVGKVAVADLAPGTLITSQQFADVADIAPGFGVVGLDLAPGEFPSFNLRPGDRVRVVVVGGDGVADNGGAVVLADEVEVVEIGEGNGRGRFVALAMEAELADQVAAAHADDAIRLIQVSGS